jgi:hypothetical protein
MDAETRAEAALAFWRDTESPEVAAQHAEALMALAKRLNFRPKSLQALPIERRAKFLAQMGDVSDAVASRALIALHFAVRRPLMAAFLEALGVSHEDGVITAEDLAPPAVAQLEAAAASIGQSFPAPDVDLYLRTLAALDGDTWGNLDALFAARELAGS